LYYKCYQSVKLSKATENKKENSEIVKPISN